MKDGLAHIQYVKNKTNAELQEQYQSVTGSYGDRDFWMENGRLFYKRKPFENIYFPKMELLPISENQYINFTRQQFQFAFEYKNGQAVANYSYIYDRNAKSWSKNTNKQDYQLRNKLRN